MIDKVKRIFLLGPPGSHKKDCGTAMGNLFNWTAISAGDLIRKEVNKKTDIGKQIEEDYKCNQYGKLWLVI